MKKLMATVGALAILAGPWAQAADDPDEACFRRKTNTARESAGVRPLADDPRIDRVAREHSDEMEADGTIYHNDDLAGDYKRAAGGYEFGGENVGMGPGCDSIFEAFMSSPGHRDNIEDEDYTHLGVGVSLGDDGTLYATLDFFTPKSSKPVKPSPLRPKSEPTRCP